MEALFAPFEAGTVDRPFVVAQLGQSLDGRIATLSGDSKYISGASALDHLHRLRAQVDAVIVGVGTVVADDPFLTVRRVRGCSPARVVLDPSGRMPIHARCLQDDGVDRIVICRTETRAPDAIEILRLPANGRTLCPRTIVAALGRRGFRRLLVEGGARTLSSFIDARCIDRLHVLVAPLILGSGKSALDLNPINALSDALRPTTQAYVLPDGNVLFDCDLRRTASDATS